MTKDKKQAVLVFRKKHYLPNSPHYAQLTAAVVAKDKDDKDISDSEVQRFIDEHLTEGSEVHAELVKAATGKAPSPEVNSELASLEKSISKEEEEEVEL